MRLRPALLPFVLALALLGGHAGHAGAASVAPTSVERLQPLDQALLQQVNLVRAQHGLRPLVPSADLGRAALLHSTAMLQGGFFTHESADGSSFSDRIKRFYVPRGYAYWSIGENLLYDSGMPSAADAVRAWMESPPHRRNMLDPNWREVGIASLHTASAGGTFAGEAATVITMDFGVRRGGLAAKAQRPRSVAAHR